MFVSINFPGFIMKSFKIMVFMIFITVNCAVIAQSGVNRWQRLNINDKKVWYDESNFDSVNDDHLDVWVLEQHTPPLVLNELPGTIYRSKTLYTINLKNAKYGIIKIIYYDSSNKELYNFNYPIENYPDNYKFTYPVLDGSVLHKILKEYFKMKGAETN